MVMAHRSVVAAAAAVAEAVDGTTPRFVKTDHHPSTTERHNGIHAVTTITINQSTRLPAVNNLPSFSSLYYRTCIDTVIARRLKIWLLSQFQIDAFE